MQNNIFPTHNGENIIWEITAWIFHVWQVEMIFFSVYERLWGTWICKVLLYFNNCEWPPREKHHFPNSFQQDFQLGIIDLEEEKEALSEFKPQQEPFTLWELIPIFSIAIFNFA